MMRCGRAQRWAGIKGLWSLRIFEILPFKTAAVGSAAVGVILLFGDCWSWELTVMDCGMCGARQERSGLFGVKVSLIGKLSFFFSFSFPYGRLENGESRVRQAPPGGGGGNRNRRGMHILIPEMIPYCVLVHAQTYRFGVLYCTMYLPAYLLP